MRFTSIFWQAFNKFATSLEANNPLATCRLRWPTTTLWWLPARRILQPPATPLWGLPARRILQLPATPLWGLPACRILFGLAAP